MKKIETLKKNYEFKKVLDTGKYKLGNQIIIYNNKRKNNNNIKELFYIVVLLNKKCDVSKVDVSIIKNYFNTIFNKF